MRLSTWIFIICACTFAYMAIFVSPIFVFPACTFSWCLGVQFCADLEQIDSAPEQKWKLMISILICMALTGCAETCNKSCEPKPPTLEERISILEQNIQIYSTQLHYLQEQVGTFDDPDTVNNGCGLGCIYFGPAAHKPVPLADIILRTPPPPDQHACELDKKGVARCKGVAVPFAPPYSPCKQNAQGGCS